MGYVAIIVLVLIIVVAFKDSWNQAQVNEQKMRGVLYTQYLGASSYETVSKTKTKTGSLVGRSVVGGALLGPAGAIIGGATAKKKTTSTTQATDEVSFLVYYDNGSIEEDKARKGTEKYKYYMSKLRQ